ncbi:MAG: epimerase [Lentisphaerae bacterium GWF2_45_14]|nr:MAG: epimerase [Lentisphaerae bacterium GWF2_45_14]
MKILVTGASGFIGSHVVKRLLSLGHEVVATARNQEKIRTFDWADKIRFIQSDLNEAKDNYFDFFENPDICIHLAWEGLPDYKSLFHIERNLPANYAFIKNMLANGLKDITVTGTCFEYGMQNGPLSENMLTIPNTPYSLAKDTLRKFIEQLKKTMEFNFKWVRLFYLYGEGQSSRSLFSQLAAALKNGDEVFNMSGGEQLRDYLSVDEVASGIVKTALQKKVTGIINCCSGKPVSVRKLVDDYIAASGRSIRLNPGYYPYADYEPMAFWGEHKKIDSIENSNLTGSI